jgi:hypothetical protein
MRLSEEKRLYPDRVNRKIDAFSENYCALIIAVLGDVFPEEAFLSLGKNRLVKLIQHRKYTTDDIYHMLELKDQGRTLTEIGYRYNLTPKMVGQIIRVYGGELKINDEV